MLSLESTSLRQGRRGRTPRSFFPEIEEDIDSQTRAFTGRVTHRALEPWRRRETPALIANTSLLRVPTCSSVHSDRQGANSSFGTRYPLVCSEDFA